MSEESGKCPICGEYLDHYGRSVLCYNTKCPLYLEAGPLVTLICALVDLVPDRPRPIETAPNGTPIMLHFFSGERCIGEINRSDGCWALKYGMWRLSNKNKSHFITDDCQREIIGVIGWTPVEEVKP